jgi:hypothetical protein
MFLYPQLSYAFAQGLIFEAARATVQEAAAQSGTAHNSAFFTATGGNRVPEEHLRTLQADVRALASSNGYPSPSSIDQRRVFDAATARLLHKQMNIVPADAARPGVWQFFAAVMLPDIVRWRFPGESTGTVEERFKGGVRNTFQRLWWRAAVLHLPDSDAPYELIDKLNEDEVVQIMERPLVAGHRHFSRAIAAAFLDAVTAADPGRRMDLMRDIQRRVFRFSSFLAFEALDSDQAAVLARDLVARSRVALKL